MKFQILTVLAMLHISSFAMAVVGVSNINQENMKSIASETGASFKHTSVSGADSADQLWNYEIGLVGGNANTNELRSLVNPNGGTTFDTAPRFGLLGLLGFGHGLTAELSVMPQIAGTFTASSQSVALKWNFTKYFTSPYEFAIKAYTGRSKVDWTQNSGFFSVPVSYTQEFIGTELQVSRRFGIFEPYANFGYLTNSGTMSANAVNVFAPDYTTANSATEKVSGLTYGVGLSTSMLFMRFSAEVSSTYQTLASAFKFSATF